MPTLIQSTVLGALGSTLTTLAGLDSTKQAVKTSSATVYFVTLDNSQNLGTNAVLKLYDAALGSVTVGTTAPTLVLTAHPGEIAEKHDDQGIAFGTAITAACVQEGGDGGTTNPPKSVTAEILH